MATKETMVTRSVAKTTTINTKLEKDIKEATQTMVTAVEMGMAMDTATDMAKALHHLHASNKR